MCGLCSNVMFIGFYDFLFWYSVQVEQTADTDLQYFPAEQYVSFSYTVINLRFSLLSIFMVMLVVVTRIRIQQDWQAIFAVIQHVTRDILVIM